MMNRASVLAWGVLFFAGCVEPGVENENSLDGIEVTEESLVGDPPGSFFGPCGDGVVNPGSGEECDDRNRTNNDGCDNDCTLPDVTGLALGENHTCALIDTGNVRCWGNGGKGRLGYGNTNTIGDNEFIGSVGNLNFGLTGGVKVASIGAGAEHTCALFTNGNVRCWGEGDLGRLGYSNTNDLGDNEPISIIGNVDLGGTVVQLAVGHLHNCALLSTGSVRCWGEGSYGKLGYGNTNNIGDNETPATAGNVNFGLTGGVTVTKLAAGRDHTCALLSNGDVKCWGEGSVGQLGYGSGSEVHSPSSVGAVPLPGPAVSLSAGSFHTCAVLVSGDTSCWGSNQFGALGHGMNNVGSLISVGDDELAGTTGPVAIEDASFVALGHHHSCVLLTTGEVRCWGQQMPNGAVGLGIINAALGIFGDFEVPGNLAPIQITGSTASLVAGGRSHSCAVLSNGKLQCWGLNDFGQLGYGNTTNIGDNEFPYQAGTVPLF